MDFSRSIIIGVFLFSFSTASSAQTQRQFLKKPDFKSLCRSALLGLSIGGGSIFIPPTYHEVKALSEGKRHIGFGIYLDMPEIMSLFSEEDRRFFEDPHRNLFKIARLLTAALYGDYEEDVPSMKWNELILPHSRDASEFFAGQSPRRGVCRHKAIILSSILHELGIEAELRGVTTSKDLAHDFVYLPAHDLVLDPTHAFIGSMSDYRRALKSAWPEVSEDERLDLPFYSKGWTY